MKLFRVLNFPVEPKSKVSALKCDLMQTCGNILHAVVEDPPELGKMEVYVP